MSNMIDLKFIHFLNKHKLSGEEFVIAYLIYKDKQEDDVNELFNEYVENNAGKFDYKELISNLENKDYIINLNKIGNYDLSKIKVTDKFADLLFVSKDLAFDEVLYVYPKIITIRIKGQPEKSLPSFENLESDAMLYFNYIAGRRDKHIRFLAVTEQYVAMNNGEANYKFSNYLERFDSIALMMESQNVKTNVDFDITM